MPRIQKKISSSLVSNPKHETIALEEYERKNKKGDQQTTTRSRSKGLPLT
jgi:hypothetical protein